MNLNLKNKLNTAGQKRGANIVRTFNCDLYDLQAINEFFCTCFHLLQKAKVCNVESKGKHVKFVSVGSIDKMHNDDV